MSLKDPTQCLLLNISKALYYLAESNTHTKDYKRMGQKCFGSCIPRYKTKKSHVLAKSATQSTILSELKL
jgi:hypothetical protein